MKTKSEMKSLKELDTLKGKFYCTHQSMYDGKRETIVHLKIKDNWYRGIAQCSLKDVFNKKIGRAIAFGRAMHKYKTNQEPLNIKYVPERYLEKPI